MTAVPDVGGGVRVVLGAVLARAGEGTVYEVTDHPQWVAKVFHPDRKDLTEKRDKIAAMIATPPPAATQDDGFVVLTWPQHLIDDPGGNVGYVMARIDTTDAVEIHTISNPADRTNPLPTAPQWPRHAQWSHLLNTAANLCLAVDAVHHVDAVIGDFQERNILVNDTTRVTLVDCDSMQFTDPTGRRYLCGVGRPEFTAPELAGVDLATTARDQPSDLFALAVHIHLLLMGGNHPFLRGEWTGPGDQPDALTLARTGQWAGGPGSALRTHPLAPPIDYLPDALRELFTAAFTTGATDPAARPTAAQWRTALGHVTVTDCGRGHQIPTETDPCPWCAIDAERQTRRTQRIHQVTPTTTIPVTAPRSAVAQHPSASPYPNAAPASPTSNTGKTIAISAAVLAVVAVLIGLLVTLTNNDDTTATSTTRPSSSTFARSSTPVTLPVASPPPDAKECVYSPVGTYGHAAAGSDLTSCPFAINVRLAVNARTGTFPAILRVNSPVTHQDYDMSCAVEQVLTCRGGNNAIVYVY